MTRPTRRPFGAASGGQRHLQLEQLEKRTLLAADFMPAAASVAFDFEVTPENPTLDIAFVAGQKRRTISWPSSVATLLSWSLTGERPSTTLG